MFLIFLHRFWKNRSNGEQKKNASEREQQNLAAALLTKKIMNKQR